MKVEVLAGECETQKQAMRSRNFLWFNVEMEGKKKGLKVSPSHTKQVPWPFSRDYLNLIRQGSQLLSVDVCPTQS